MMIDVCLFSRRKYIVWIYLKKADVWRIRWGFNLFFVE